MSNETLQKPYQQRFKGVENFLRRVAFNLGNTASQTEVKIISCIPIDVTDLQQKIINLEKQLHEAKQQGGSAPAPAPAAGPSVAGDKGATSDKPPAVVNTALYGSSFARHSSTVSYCSDNIKSRQVAAHCGECSSRPRKSNVSFVFPALSTIKGQKPCSMSSHEDFNTGKDNKNIAIAERYMSIFKNKKKKRIRKGKSKMKTHLVYFAQHAQNNPFNINEITLNHFETLNNINESISHSYLDEVIRRQYDPKFVVEEFSDTSHFSKPICKDTSENNTCFHPYESDVCSCCYGQFQNLDNYMTKNFDPVNNSRKYNRNNTNNRYYDSNLYDLVPVKEITNKGQKEDIFSKRNLELRCRPKTSRNKCRYNPMKVNYHTEIPAERHLDNKIQSSSSPKIKERRKQEKCNAKQKHTTKQDQVLNIDTSKSFSIDCGYIYKKHIFPTTKIQKSPPVKTILLKNELTETDDIYNKLLLHNQSTQLEVISNENKTESTLNQIKSILQSVLAEVKTSTKVNTAVEQPLKLQKDAIVQKGASQNNMQGDSTLLHSFTYNNSYYANPFLPSCSRQTPGGQYCFNGLPYQPPLKCLQNFPMFIHPASGKPMCACYYNNSSLKSPNYKPGTTTATNTDKEVQIASSYETEKLIKEIYKSMALNMDFPTKDNSASEYDDLKSTEHDFIKESISKNVQSVGIGLVDKRDVEIEALVSPKISRNSKLVYTAVSTQSEGRNCVNRSQFYKTIKDEVNHHRISPRIEQHSTDTAIAEDDEETYASYHESENDDVDNLHEYSTSSKRKKKGLFQRMFQSVKLFKRRKAKEKLQSESEEVSESSDSNDCETIQTDRTPNEPSPSRQNQKQRVYTKVKSFTQNPIYEKARRSPYLEQEYRRQWNERLMFDKLQEQKYSSDRPFSKQSTPKGPSPIYWNRYETRNALVRSNSPPELRCRESNSEGTKASAHRLPYKTLRNGDSANGKLGWFQKHKPELQCGEQWKKFILEN